MKEVQMPLDEGVALIEKGYLDEETERLVASSKTNRFLDNKELTVKQFDEVDLIVSHPSEIGMNVIVNKTHLGLVFKDDIYKDISVGDRLKGIVKKVRHDNKLDISLNQIGFRNIEPNAEVIMKELEDNSGYLNLTDKSDPEDIKRTLQMSKKNFKRALGNLYKQRLVRLEKDGTYLIG